MAGGEDESVAIEPARVVGILLEGVSIKDCADFRATEREAEMAGIAGMDGIHGETASFGGGAGERVGVDFHD